MSANRSAMKLVLCVIALLIVVPSIPAMAGTATQDEPAPTASRASSRAPEACPGGTAGWIITGTHTYTGTCSVTGGHVNIQAGADITFEKVTMTITGSYYLYNYATMRILNSTITGASNWYGVLGQTGAILNKIENSTIKNFYSYGIRAYTASRIEVGNSTFEGASPTGQYGIYSYNTNGGYITKNKIKNPTSYGIYLYMSSSVWANNNTVTMNTGTYAALLNSFGGKFDNNTISMPTSGTNVIRVQSMTPNSFYGNVGKGASSIIKLYLSGVTLNAYNCNVSGTGATDVSVQSSGRLRAYDTAFNTSAVGAGSFIEVHRKANMSVTWLSNGQAVQGATIEVTDAKGGKDPRSFVTDASGKVLNNYFMEYLKDGTSKKDKSPYWFNATANKGGKDFANHTRGNITNDTNKNKVDIILDDVPPPLKIIGPVDGLFTNISSTIVKAQTERNISKEWPLIAEVLVGAKIYSVPIGQDGYIEQNVSLPSDAKHLITVRIVDSALNTKAGYLNVTRDTVNPPLTVTAPVDAYLTNVTMVQVTGTTEASADLTINGVSVPVQAGGSFTHNYALTEGDNAIVVKVMDKAKNWQQKTVNVKLDTRAPILAILQPANNFRTNQGTIQFQGSTEPKSAITINGNSIPLFGTATAFQTTVNLKEGENVFVVISCDAAKNCNQTEIHVFLDTAPPGLTVSSPEDQFLTNVETLVIKGVTDDGARVMVNDRPATVTGTEFTYEATLREGKNTFRIASFDDVNNKAERSLTVYLDKTPPALAITDPEDNKVVSNADLKVEGTTETNAVVKVNGISTPNPNGGFSTKVTLKEGPNNITVTAVDKAGNMATVKVQVTLDTKVDLSITGPKQTVGLETMNTTINITGTTDKDATIYINDLPVAIKKDGSFKQEVPLNVGLNNITVVAQDKLGNEKSYSIQVTRKEKPSPPPPIPIINNKNGLAGLLIPIAIIIAVVAVIGVAAGVAMRRKKTPEVAPAPAPITPAPAAPVPAPVYPQAPPPQTYQPPSTYQQPTAYQQPPLYQQQEYSSPPMAVMLPPPPPPQYTADSPTPAGISDEAWSTYNEAQKAVDEAEARGEDVSRRRTHLRVAQTFLNKGNSEKVLYYSKKVLGRE